MVDLKNPIAALSAGILALVFTNYILFPSSIFVPSALVTVGVSVIAYIIYQGWETSNANEWLLIIENGVQKKAGIGLRCFRTFQQTAVKFPSKINRVISGQPV